MSSLAALNRIGRELTVYKKLSELDQESLYKIINAEFYITRFGKRVLVTLKEDNDFEEEDEFSVFLPKRFEKVSDADLEFLKGKYMSITVTDPALVSSIKIHFHPNNRNWGESSAQPPAKKFKTTLGDLSIVIDD